MPLGLFLFMFMVQMVYIELLIRDLLSEDAYKGDIQRKHHFEMNISHTRS